MNTISDPEFLPGDTVLPEKTRYTLEHKRFITEVRYDGWLDKFSYAVNDVVGFYTEPQIRMTRMVLTEKNLKLEYVFNTLK